MNVKIIHLLLIQNALTTDSNISFFKLPFKKNISAWNQN